VPAFHGLLAELETIRGEIDSAVALIEWGVEMAKENEERFTDSYLYRLRGDPRTGGRQGNGQGSGPGFKVEGLEPIYVHRQSRTLSQNPVGPLCSPNTKSFWICTGNEPLATDRGPWRNATDAPSAALRRSPTPPHYSYIIV
jgi:hypothetical protein